ncbi:short-chain dehydrogenase TIC 32, chloroplastic-like isoform X2 [Ananas comosus]|uniref:Short-chain dehydrogenase TIC 32, chloroplastic n=1 Tax=Ananas comosus TaxID=4615 RepID=A0A199UKY0_ANACO|nr:short-chain dehydrogenase TIC 32, chloroplastic-like isoform X2 [Ananas comosus]OAY65552.1 Short-chain dehydrogenase TIC 32, chloroplastic [Ananas comosus]
MWRLLGRRGPSGYSSSSTAEEVTEGIDGSGLTAIVTGASSGIGAETCRVLALRGVHVIMGVRNASAGACVKAVIIKEIPNAKVDVMVLDLSSMSSIRNFAENFNSQNLPLNILINNAGIAFAPFTLSEDGIELHFATNHLGHFLLTHLLLEGMKRTAQETNIEGRIIIVSSDSYKLTYHEGIRFDRINDELGYKSILAYGQSKLANILHAQELSKQLKHEDVKITVNALHPGGIVTNIMRYQGFLDGLVATLGKYVLKNVQQGAATTCYLALHPQVRGVSGKFFVDSNITEVKSHATDEDLAKKLWDFSMGLIKVQMTS